MEPIRCFLLEETDQVARFLRRYVSSSDCTLGHSSYHNAQTRIEDGTTSRDEKGCVAEPTDDVPHSDPRWPTHCECGYEFQPGDEWQVFCLKLYRRSDTGELVHTHEDMEGCAPAGALWRCQWLEGLKGFGGTDGQVWQCMTPCGGWIIDSTASNCTRRDEPHHCWCRHGIAPDFHVDKTGNTCNAGAGSIIMTSADRTWHGFLHNGCLVEC